jgi:hypothetical protein
MLATRTTKAPALLAEIEVRYRDSLFDAEPLPVVAPPRPKALPRKRDKIPPPSLPLAYPPSIADMLARLAPTHQAVAERDGLSRQQVTKHYRPALRGEPPDRSAYPRTREGRMTRTRIQDKPRREGKYELAAPFGQLEARFF